MREFQRYAIVVAAFATMLYLAVLIAAFGLLSLYTDLDVIPQKDAGPLVGPLMCAIATAVVLFGLISIGVRVAPEKQRISIGGALGIGFVAYFGYVVLGSAIYGAGSGDPFQFFLFAGAMFVSPFSATAGVVAFLITLAYMLVLASHVGEHGRPRWPWEHPDDE